MRACWLKWVGRDWSISADYIWLNYSGANICIHSFRFTADLIDLAKRYNSGVNLFELRDAFNRVFKVVGAKLGYACRKYTGASCECFWNL